MHSDSVKNKFVELRSKGKSFKKISEELGISKPTLISWSKEFEFEISNLKAIEFEYFLEELKLKRESRLKALSEFISKVEKELAKRELSDIPTIKLVELNELLWSKVIFQSGHLVFKKESDSILDSMGFEKVNEWTA